MVLEWIFRSFCENVSPKSGRAHTALHKVFSRKYQYPHENKIPNILGSPYEERTMKMAEETPKEKIKIKDKDYEVESLTDQQKYYISQIKSLNQKTFETKFLLDQHEASSSVFKDLLIKSVEEEDTNDEGNKQ